MILNDLLMGARMMLHTLLLFLCVCELTTYEMLDTNGLLLFFYRY